MYCVKFGQLIKPYHGFFMPYNATREIETYSLTYLPPSVLNGIEDKIGIPIDSIVRHKLLFYKGYMQKEQVKTSYGDKWVGGVSFPLYHDDDCNGIHLKHLLVNPTLILAFNNRDFAEKAKEETLYMGQKEYIVYPIRFDDGAVIREMSEEEFNNLPGVETFETDEEGIDCGFNRFKNNKPMFVNINRKEWENEDL